MSNVVFSNLNPQSRMFPNNTIGSPSSTQATSEYIAYPGLQPATTGMLGGRVSPIPTDNMIDNEIFQRCHSPIPVRSRVYQIDPHQGSGQELTIQGSNQRSNQNGSAYGADRAQRNSAYGASTSRVVTKTARGYLNEVDKKEIMRQNDPLAKRLKDVLTEGNTGTLGISSAALAEKRLQAGLLFYKDEVEACSEEQGGFMLNILAEHIRDNEISETFCERFIFPPGSKVGCALESLSKFFKKPAPKREERGRCCGFLALAKNAFVTATSPAPIQRLMAPTILGGPFVGMLFDEEATFAPKLAAHGGLVTAGLAWSLYGQYETQKKKQD